MKKSVVLQVRIDPYTRFCSEIAAKTQRRSLSSYIAESVYQENKKRKVKSTNTKIDGMSVEELSELVWDEHEAVRFINIAKLDTRLLTEEERPIWYLICETEEFFIDGDVNVPLVKELWNWLYKNAEQFVKSNWYDNASFCQAVKEIANKIKEKENVLHSKAKAANTVG